MKEWVKENKLNIKEYLDKDEQKDLLRLLTAGSVDDGKSTLIGRLLFDRRSCTRTSLPLWNVTANVWGMQVTI